MDRDEIAMVNEERILDDVGIYNIDRIIKYVIYKHYKYLYNIKEDLFQTGYLGYLKAKKNHNEEQGNMKLGYVTSYIRKEIDSFYGKQDLNNYSEYQEPVEMSLEDTLDKERIKEALFNNSANLTLTEYEIIYRLYLKSNIESEEKIAECFGVTQQRINKLKQSALQKLKEYFSEN